MTNYVGSPTGAHPRGDSTRSAAASAGRPARILTGPHRVILGLVAVLMLAAANLAWLNPSPESEAYRTLDQVPVFWQYSVDTGLEVMTAAYFPAYFHKYNIRVSRPVYPAVVKTLGEVIGLLAWPVASLSPVMKAGLGFVAWNALFALVSAWCAFRIFARFLTVPYALFGVALMLFHWETVTGAAMFHSTAAEYFTPVLIAYLALELGDRFSYQRTVLFSVLIGIMMLAKTNYAAYLAALAVAVLYLRLVPAAVSFVVHLIPLGLWLLFLRSQGLAYYNHEVEYYGQGQEFAHALTHFDVATIATMVRAGTLDTVRYGLIFFNVLLPFAAIGGWALRRRLGFPVWLFLAMFVAAVVVEISASELARLVSDLKFAVCGLAAAGVASLAARLPALSRPMALSAVAGLWLFVNLAQMAHLPWVSPYEQKVHSWANKDTMFEREYLTAP